MYSSSIILLELHKIKYELQIHISFDIQTYGLKLRIKLVITLNLYIYIYNFYEYGNLQSKNGDLTTRQTTSMSPSAPPVFVTLNSSYPNRRRSQNDDANELGQIAALNSYFISNDTTDIVKSFSHPGEHKLSTIPTSRKYHYTSAKC